jgi:hypothetical protein
MGTSARVTPRLAHKWSFASLQHRRTDSPTIAHTKASAHSPAHAQGLGTTGWVKKMRARLTV